MHASPSGRMGAEACLKVRALAHLIGAAPLARVGFGSDASIGAWQASPFAFRRHASPCGYVADTPSLFSSSEAIRCVLETSERTEKVLLHLPAAHY
jgi:hypothetical protein